MKKIIILLLALCPLLLSAQNTGTIEYRETVKIDMELPEDSGISEADFSAMMPNENIAKKMLYFDESASLFTNPPNVENHDGEYSMSTGDGGEIRIKTVSGNGNNKVFHDIKNNKITDQREFLGKTFLVIDEAKAYNWKLSGTTKEIGSHSCQQATAEDDGTKIEAWFTTEIPVSTGPDNIMNLPGLVLEASIVGERIQKHLIAESIRFEPLEAGTLKAPNKGKKVSEKEFDQIVEEKTREMSEGGGMRIRIGN